MAMAMMVPMVKVGLEEEFEEGVEGLEMEVGDAVVPPRRFCWVVEVGKKPGCERNS